MGAKSDLARNRPSAKSRCHGPSPVPRISSSISALRQRSRKVQRKRSRATDPVHGEGDDCAARHICEQLGHGSSRGATGRGAGRAPAQKKKIAAERTRRHCASYSIVPAALRGRRAWRLRGGRVHQTLLDAVAHQLGHVGEIHLLHDVGLVGADGLDAQVQPLGDLGNG